MGIQKSNLDEITIKRILKDNYEINVLKTEEINRGTANIFKITTKENKYILKEFSEGRTEESVIKETKIINFLKNKNIKVPVYIRTINNSFYIKFENRIVILQEYIDGYTMENNTGDYNKTIESATILGKLTKELKVYEDLGEDGIIAKWFSKDSLEKGIAKIEDLKNRLNDDNPYKDRFIKDLEEKIKMSKDLMDNFDFDIIRKMTIMNTHGDYSVQQLIYSEKNETTVIDFETAKKLPIIWEVMRSYSYIDKAAKDGELNIDTLVAYVKEFTQYVELNEYDLKYAAQIYLLQIVSSPFGYKQYNEDYSKTGLLEFALFRTNLCRYLYKHSNEISLRLQKEIKIAKE